MKVGQTCAPRLPRAKIHKIKKNIFNLLKDFKSYEVLSFTKIEVEEQTQKNIINQLKIDESAWKLVST